MIEKPKPFPSDDLAYYMVRETIEQPYGGPDWPQKSGYEVLKLMIESTERAIERVIEEDYPELK